MKLTSVLVIAAICAAAFAAPTCVKTNYCMGCHASTADTCVSCFNWMAGKVGPRTLNSTTNCQTALTTRVVTDCKVYNGSVATPAGTKLSSDCQVCNKDFKNWTNSSSTLACSNTALTLTGTTCAKVANCMQVLCNDDTTDSFGCVMCNKNYSGATYVNSTVGTSSCTKTNAVTNCEVMYYGSSISDKYCHYCKSGFAVANANTSCVAFTTDSNCRHLQSGDTACRTCWDAYYWDATKCKLAAKVAVATLILALINFLF